MSSTDKNSERSNKLIEAKDIYYVWRLILKNILIIILFPIIAYTLGYIYSYRLPNVYGSKSELLLKSNETYDYQDPIYKGLGAYGMYMDVQNQIRILTSRDLIGEVIDKINVETSYFISGRLRKQEVFRTLPFGADVEVINAEVFEKPVAVKILDKKKYSLSYELGGLRKSFQGEFGSVLNTSDFIVVLEKGYTFQDESMGAILEPDYELVFHSRENLIGKYRRALHVENLEHTSVLSISITDELQGRAKVFLDTLTHSYIERSERVQQEVNRNTLENIEKQIDTVSLFITEKEIELLRYKNTNAILNVEKEESEYFDEYVVYSKEKRRMERKLNSALLLRKYLEDSYDDRALPPSFYIEQSDNYLQRAVENLREKQVAVEIARTHHTEDSFQIVNLLSEITNLRNDIITYLNNLEHALKVEVDIHQEFIEEFEISIKKMPKSAQGVLNIQRELDVNNKMYLFLLEKKTNTLIARAGIIPQVRLIEQTINQGVVSPDKSKIKSWFVIGGVILSLLIAILRSLFFEKISTVAELSESTNLTIIGGVPLSKNKQYHLMIEENPKSNGTESFRTIRTNISFMPKSEGKARKMLVSSFHPGEGKTFCSTNIGALIARGDKKVLFIDFDLHRPKIHKVLNLENKLGVSTFIIGKAQIEEIVHKEIRSNLDVITSGPIAPNPSELILSNKIDELIEWAEKNYDFIIFDTPPFGILNDTFELINKVDNILIVAKANVINKRGIAHIESLMSRADNKSYGLILNGIKQSKLQYYYAKYGYTYSYNYGYNYGYGYGEGYTDSTEE